MEIFWCRIEDLKEQRLLHTGRSKSHGSAFAWSLLSYAVETVWSCPLPEVSLTASGKPFFPMRTDICFSLSHTKTAALAAVSASPIGADVERRKKYSAALERRLFDVPHGDLDLFELWTLRESWLKLTGEGDLRSIPFSRSNGEITGPVEGLFSRLYDEIPGCAAAVCSFQEAPPDQLHFVALKDLIRKD